MKTPTIAEYEEMDPSEKIDLYLQQNEMWHFEGSEGVRKFEDLLRALNYNDCGGFMGDHPIHNFLSDNPGAIERLIEFIHEYAGEEQVEGLDVELAEEEEE